MTEPRELMEHTRQEEALRLQRYYCPDCGCPIFPHSPPPVASGETAEEAQFTPEAWEKLTQQHQAFLARRSVASGTEAAE